VADETRISDTGRLARLGFQDPTRAARLLADPALGDLAEGDAVLTGLAEAADPDLALLGLTRLAEAAPDAVALREAVRADDGLRTRLVAVLGLSTALGEHLARHPEHWRDLLDPPRPATADALRADLLRSVGADPASPDPTAAENGRPVMEALRIAYRRHLIRLAARDLADGEPVQAVAAELADLAAAALEAGLAIGRAGLAPDDEPCRLAVIGMGKCGGRELNYISDVDVILVAEPLAGGDERAALATGTDLARRMVHACSAATAEGSLWAVDTALRPEGRNGPLVRTLASHVSYYERWAKTWEFQALLKARPVAGDAELGRAYIDAVAPFIWSAADRDNFVEEVQGMRRRVEAHIKPGQAHRHVKLGPGGLRDVEFAVQLLQLVHGRSDVFLRSPTTLDALEQLSTRGYVGRADAGELDRAYRFLRTLEHRIQLHRLRRTHMVPDSEADLRRLGRSLGMRTDPVNELTETWRRHAREVRRLHEKLFYRPLLAAVARLPGEEARLTPEAAKDRLVALGYVDPAGALRHIEALTKGLSRRAAIQRTLLPVMLGWFADGPDPDAGLLGFRQVSEALGSTHWYLRFLRDEGAAAERVATVLSSGKYATDLLMRAPEAVGMLGDTDDLAPRSRETVEPEALRSAQRHDDPVSAIAAVRAVRRRELFRTAVADLLGLAGVEGVGEGLTAVAAATLEAGLTIAVRAVQAERRAELPTRLAVIAMGRLGGHEMSYASDADVMFVHEPFPGVAEDEAARAALEVIQELRRLLAIPMADPPLPVDADLRPEGRNGPLVRSLASYRAYYARWGEVWERQALLRAEPLCGDRELAERFMVVVDPLRWPEGGLTAEQVREVRRIKARVESERLPRGADPSRHTKLGPGGLADVEWTAQLLQLRHAHEAPALRTTRTVEALDAAVGADLLAPSDRDALATSWRTVSRVRNAALLVRTRGSDELPRDTRELATVARVLGYEPGETAAFLDHYLRVTRRARGVVDRVFFGS